MQITDPSHSLNETQQLRDAYDLLAQYPDECDVEYTIVAQAEVMLNEEHYPSIDHANSHSDNHRL